VANLRTVDVAECNHFGVEWSHAIQIVASTGFNLIQYLRKHLRKSLGETRVMTTAIVLETRRGNFGTALTLGLVLLGIAFAVNVLLTIAQQRRTRLWS